MVNNMRNKYYIMAAKDKIRDMEMRGLASELTKETYKRFVAELNGVDTGLPYETVKQLKKTLKEKAAIYKRDSKKNTWYK